MSTAGQTATSGAARKARERKARAHAKHVAWLASNYQILSAHHTGAGSELAQLRVEVQLLKAALGSLQAEISGLRSQGKSSDDTALQEKVHEPSESDKTTQHEVERHKVQLGQQQFESQGNESATTATSAPKAPAVKKQRIESSTDRFGHVPEQVFRVALRASSLRTARSQCL